MTDIYTHPEPVAQVPRSEAPSITLYDLLVELDELRRVIAFLMAENEALRRRNRVV